MHGAKVREGREGGVSGFLKGKPLSTCCCTSCSAPSDRGYLREGRGGEGIESEQGVWGAHAGVREILWWLERHNAIINPPLLLPRAPPGSTPDTHTLQDNLLQQ